MRCRLTAVRALTVLSALMAVLVACGADAPRSSPLLIATGQRGGVYFDYGTGLAKAISAELPGVRPQVLTTGASVDNLRMIASGRADVAFTLADSAALAVRGEPPFDRPQPVRALARLYDNYVHLVVRANSGITSPAHLRGRVISGGAAGSGTEVIAKRLLGVTGLDPDRDLTVRSMDLGTSAEALRAGAIDAFFFSGGLPTKTISELAGQKLIRLVDLRSYASPMRRRYGEFYSERTIPASTYGLPESGTIGVPDYLIVRQDMDDALAHDLTELLFTHREALELAHPEARRLNVRAAFSTDPVILHPGAVRYYRDTRS
ncbi:TAXI family TRAP transporter solute-binding subunit [Streptosporangium sp. NPDC000396]|uniref:TAXI family TRAP transporter solute-binding subunit n=1 Tax=Streptosporangium sp. NPDC000396 TaxID=3366185 RepID=UPI003678CB87